MATRTVDPKKNRSERIRKTNFFDEIYVRTRFLSGPEPVCFSDELKPSLLSLASKVGNHKGSVYYTAHSYPTKVPVEYITRYILENTRSGDTILDPFCGSGMTGLAARLTGRSSQLSDVGSLALHLSTNHTSHCDPDLLLKTGKELLQTIRNEYNPYSISHGGDTIEVSATILSEVYECGNCHHEVVFWNVAIDSRTFEKRKAMRCTFCSKAFVQRGAKKLSRMPAFIYYRENGSSRLSHCSIDTALGQIWLKKRIPAVDLPIEDIEIGPGREMYLRSALHLQGIKRLSDFYSKRNLNSLSRLYSEIRKVRNARLQAALMFAFTNVAWHASLMRRFNANGGHRPLTGTLYIPQLSSEGNVFEMFEHKLEMLARYYSETELSFTRTRATVSHSSATNLSHLEDNSIDYVFTDPPFGSNIFYADCNFLGEAWLGRLTEAKSEAVINRSLKQENGGKSIEDYTELMTASFREISRVLKAGKSLHVVFNSSDGDVWSCLFSALRSAGFQYIQALPLDKIQKSFKGNKSAYSQESVPTTDLVLELVNRKTSQKSKNMRPIGNIREVVAKALEAFDNKKDQLSNQLNSKFFAPDFFAFFLMYCYDRHLDVAGTDFKKILNALPEKAKSMRVSLLPPGIYPRQPRSDQSDWI